VVNRRHLPSVAHGKVPQQGSLPKSKGQGVSGGYRRVGDMIQRARGSIDLAEEIELPTMKVLFRQLATNRPKNVPETVGDQEDEMSIRDSRLHVNS
jgi:hypothetical protein